MATFCFEEMREVLKEKIDPDQLAVLMEDVEKRFNIDAGKKGRNLSNQEIHNLLQKIKSERTQDSLINLRNRIQQTKISVQRAEWAFREFPDDPYKALLSLFQTEHTAGNVRATGVSYNARAITHQTQMIGNLLTRLEKKNLLKLARKGKINREIMIELHDGKAGGKSLTGNKNAKDIADEIRQTFDVSAEIQNRNGAYINKLDNYQGRQVHMKEKLVAAGFDTWYRDIINSLDHVKTFGDNDPEIVMRNVYDNIVTGKEFNSDDVFYISPLTKDVQKKASAHRKMFFKDGNAYWDYNLKYGTGDRLLDSVAGQIETASRISAQLEVFGPSMEQFVDSYYSQMRSKYRGNPEALKKLENKQSYIKDTLMPVVTGEANQIGNHHLATVGFGIRSMNAMSTLGAVAISQFPDLAVASSMMRLHGESFLGSFGSLLGNLVTGKPKGWQKEFADYLGVGTEGMLGSIYSRLMAEDNFTGNISSVMNKFFKMTGMEWINDTNKVGVSLILSKQLGNNRRVKWSKLNPDLQRELSKYDIGDREWEIVRRSAQTAENGKWYVSPAKIADVKETVIKKIFPELKNDLQIDAFKNRLELNLSTYYIDSVNNAILTPGVREAARATQGFKRGTPLGEAARLVMQLKNFPVMVLTRGLGRIYKTRGSISAAIPEIATMVLTTTMLGYMSMSAKEMLKGRKPRSPIDAKTWGAALTQGGGAGIYGDFLFGTSSRYGHSFLATAGGPTAADIENIARMIGSAREGDMKRLGDESFKFFKGNLPFVNLFYTKLMVDHFILHQMQEYMNPGYMNRMEKRIKKDNNQELWLSPTKGVNF